MICYWHVDATTAVVTSGLPLSAFGAAAGASALPAALLRLNKVSAAAHHLNTSTETGCCSKTSSCCLCLKVSGEWWGRRLCR
ncbi:hypothetical protein HaLaN_28201 [Haematococcus lacustris]|uniref:Uncharacterized protein n=1 Tax=Haematococcus lacustris TaxID=44745 RepID=A0A6A0ABV0_HAELA|nr:hypothetical protein HaLaN_28201 [Haematococcus lacustris]